MAILMRGEATLEEGGLVEVPDFNSITADVKIGRYVIRLDLASETRLRNYLNRRRLDAISVRELGRIEPLPKEYKAALEEKTFVVETNDSEGRDYVKGTKWEVAANGTLLIIGTNHEPNTAYAPGYWKAIA